MSLRNARSKQACFQGENRRPGIAENWRFRSCRALRAEISAGTIGRPIRLRIAHRDTRALREGGYDDQPYFRTLPRLTLLEMGCHLVDTARFLIGEVETVFAALGKFGSHSIGEDVATLSLQFASDCLSRPGVSSEEYSFLRTSATTQVSWP